MTGSRPNSPPIEKAGQPCTRPPGFGSMRPAPIDTVGVAAPENLLLHIRIRNNHRRVDCPVVRNSAATSVCELAVLRIEICFGVGAACSGEGEQCHERHSCTDVTGTKHWASTKGGSGPPRGRR